MDSSVSSLDSDSTLVDEPVAFPFLNLPTELRLRVYELLLTLPESNAIDLNPQNSRSLAPIFLPLFLTCRRINAEASRVFYRNNVFRLFPTNGFFIHTKKPLLARLDKARRAQITALEIRLGPGWTKPPRGWIVNEKLGLQDCAKLRRLNVFVECDPAAHEIFRGFRTSDTFYTDFCVALIRDVFDAAPSIHGIELDGNPSVHKDSQLVVALRREATVAGKRVTWGAQFRGQEELEAVLSRISSLASLTDAMAAAGMADDAPSAYGIQTVVPQVLSEA